MESQVQVNTDPEINLSDNNELGKYCHNCEERCGSNSELTKCRQCDKEISTQDVCDCGSCEGNLCKPCHFLESPLECRIDTKSNSSNLSSNSSLSSSSSLSSNSGSDSLFPSSDSVSLSFAECGCCGDVMECNEPYAMCYYCEAEICHECLLDNKCEGGMLDPLVFESCIKCSYKRERDPTPPPPENDNDVGDRGDEKKEEKVSRGKKDTENSRDKDELKK